MSTPRILIVDDEPSNIQVLIAILQRDYTLTVANSGAKALNMATRYPQPNLILLDIMMPDLTGYEVCRHLKENPLTRSIPVVFVTALSEIGNEAKGFELGAVDYITKPVSPAIVRARVKSHLEMQQLTHQLQAQNESLKAALQMRQDLSHMIVHDLRNPLASILLACSLLKIKGVGLNEYHIQKIDQISSEAKAIDSLIDNILVTAKLETDKLLLHPESTSLNDWDRHLAINLTAPFLLSQAFAQQAEDGARIINILDWRALRPGADHFPYTVTKSALEIGRAHV